MSSIDTTHDERISSRRQTKKADTLGGYPQYLSWTCWRIKAYRFGGVEQHKQGVAHAETGILWRIIEIYEAIRVAGDQAGRRPTGCIRRSGTRAGGEGGSKHSHFDKTGGGREDSAADSRAVPKSRDWLTPSLVLYLAGEPSVERDLGRRSFLLPWNPTGHRRVALLMHNLAGIRTHYQTTLADNEGELVAPVC